MASTSVPQQGSLSTETVNQLGTLDSTQLNQLLRNLSPLLKVSYCPSIVRRVLSCRWRCDRPARFASLGPVVVQSPRWSCTMTIRSLESHVIARGSWTGLIFPTLYHSTSAVFLFSAVVLVLMTSFSIA